MTISLYQAALLHGKAYRILRQNVVGLLKKCDLTLHEWVLLSLLAETGRQSSSALALEIGVELPMITQLTLLLEKRELIQRVTGQSDKRQRFFSLTTKGKKLVKNCEANLQKELAGYFAELSVQDIEGHINVLKHIIAKQFRR